MLAHWRFDPFVLVSSVATIVMYLAGVARYARVRLRAWPGHRSAFFIGGVVVALLAIESPLDAMGDAAFTPHMLQHLILTDCVAPLLLLGAPILLVLGAAPTAIARRIVALMRSRVARVVAFPATAWLLFMLSLWTLHFTPFYEAALEHEPIHILEHAMYLGTGVLFWLPVIAIGPVPWMDGPLAYPLRMLYLMTAMPAEGFLGFVLFGGRHVLYARYVTAGLADQQFAGELMWVGGSLAMFAAFMICGAEWARAERRLGERYDRLAGRPA